MTEKEGIMKIAVISYSLTGNNDALAASIASAFSAEHIRITETKPRTNAAIALDMLFNRTPKVNPVVEKMGENDLVIFVAPVWMGKVASPLRACFKRLKSRLDRYIFVSISGGADGPNPKLAGELRKRLGKEPILVIDHHIVDLLPPDPKPTRQDTASYRLTKEDVKSLTDSIIEAINKAMVKHEISTW